MFFLAWSTFQNLASFYSVCKLQSCRSLKSWWWGRKLRQLMVCYWCLRLYLCGDKKFFKDFLGKKLSKACFSVKIVKDAFSLKIVKLWSWTNKQTDWQTDQLTDCLTDPRVLNFWYVSANWLNDRCTKFQVRSFILKLLIGIFVIYFGSFSFEIKD